MFRMKFRYEEFDLTGVRTYPLAAGRARSHDEQFAQRVGPGAGLRGWLASLPNLLAAADFRAVVAAIRRRASAPIAASSGASARTSSRPASRPCIIDLMERGFVSAIAMNGAGLIHDFEVALGGVDVRGSGRRARPGPVRHGRGDRARLNARITAGASAASASARPYARICGSTPPPFARLSLLCAAARLGIPVTVHVGHRHRHHPHASRRVGRGDRRRQPARLPVLHVVRRRDSKAACTSTAARP